MYDPLWQAVLPHLSTARMRADIEEFCEFSRWSSYDKIVALARLIAAKMEAAGMSDVRLIEAPADGKTCYGGWMMPRAYDVEMARLGLVAEDGMLTVLADYHDNPTSLMLYSLPTPSDGLTAELVIADNLAECHAAALKGRLVLTSCGGVEFSRTAMQAGALGILCDGQFGRRFFKTGDYLNHTNEWHNYTIAPWDEPNKGFGFSLSPDQGQQLRARLGAGETVRLHALVKTHHYDGVLPVVSGRLPGTGAEEIVITGHYDEFGADDNCSQVAVGLEVARAIRALVEAGEMPPLTRGIRLLFPMEARGFNALVQDPEEIKNFRLGLNIDTVGTDQNVMTATCALTDSFIAALSFAEELLAELLERVAEENPLFRWQRVAADVIDNVFGEPLIGAPIPCLYHYSATHHLPLDTPERINDRMLRDMARVTATYAGFVANAGLTEAMWLAELVADHAVRRLEECGTRVLRHPLDAERFDALSRQTDTICQSYYQRLDSLKWLVRGEETLPTPEALAAADEPLDEDFRLLPQELYAQDNDLMRERIRDAQDRVDDYIWYRANNFWQVDAPTKKTPVALSHCVPVKAFRGFLAFEDLNAQEREYVTRELGIEMGWSAPGWLQNALMLANGKRTAGEIADLLRQHGNYAPDILQLEKIFEFLQQRGQVRLRPYLTQAVIKDALIKAGLTHGDAVLGHFSLSRFGYIEGGADALIKTLLDVLGSEGTLMVPTFTFSWLGHPPYNPTETPSKVGTVTDYFRRWREAQRSLHPTHSFGALGPLAPSLLEGHDHTQPPLGENSPIARLAAANGKILMFAPKKSNTSMHVGEYLAGLPFIDLVCPVGQLGQWQPVVVPRCPWHVNFEAAYEQLYARNLIRDVPLGESVIHTMRCGDAIEAQATVAREAPESLLQAGCACAYCQRLKGYCREQGRLG